MAGLCSLLAISPDLDFLPGLLQGQPALYHQGISHSLGFAVSVSLFTALLYARGRAVMPLSGLFFLAYASHLFMDILGEDIRPPYGIPLFWPLSEQYYLAPLQIFRGVRHVGGASGSGTTAEWMKNVVDLYNLGTITIELGVLLPLILLTEYFGKSTSRRSHSG